MISLLLKKNKVLRVSSFFLYLDRFRGKAAGAFQAFQLWKDIFDGTHFTDVWRVHQFGDELLPAAPRTILLSTEIGHISMLLLLSINAKMLQMTEQKYPAPTKGWTMSFFGVADTHTRIRPNRLEFG